MVTQQVAWAPFYLDESARIQGKGPPRSAKVSEWYPNFIHVTYKE